MTVSLINSGMGHPDHEWSRETMAREAELIRQAEAAFRLRLSAGLVGFTERCRAAGMPHRQIKACREAIGLSVERTEVFAALASTLPSDIVRNGSVGQFADAYLREIAASVPSFAEAAE